MSATTAHALKQIIESAGLGVAAYRDRQPENEALPYVVIHEAIAVTPEAAFSQLDDEEGHVLEQVQIDLWEQWRNSNGSSAHDFTLPDALALTLRNARPDVPPTHVVAIRLIDGPHRFLQVEENLLRHAYTVEVHRLLIREGS